MARNKFYVDDLITGTDDVDTALSLQQELIEMLKNGGFTLRKGHQIIQHYCSICHLKMLKEMYC